MKPGRRAIPEELERVARSLDSSVLTGGVPLGDGDLIGRGAHSRVLDWYAPEGIAHALEAYSLLGALRERGFGNLELLAVPRPDGDDLLRVSGEREGARHLLVEAVLDRSRVHLRGAWWEVIELKWLLLQDPTRPFPQGRAPLPGQSHTGLGLASRVVAVVALAATRLGCDGVLLTPSHLHSAILLGPGHPWGFRFVDPADAARFHTIRAHMDGLTLAEASAQAQAAGRWVPCPLVLPVSDRARRVFRR